MSEVIETELRVGALWHGAFPKTYWQHFNLLEIPADKVATLKRRTVARWMGDDDGSRTLVVPFSPDLKSGALDMASLDSVGELLTIAESALVLFHTPGSFRPTQANVELLKRWFDEMNARNMDVAWSAEGLWSKEEQSSIADDSKVRIVVDPLDDEFDEIPESTSRFYRVKGRRGFQNQLTDHELFVIQERVQNQLAFVSFGLSGFWTDALRFNRVLQQQDEFWS